MTFKLSPVKDDNPNSQVKGSVRVWSVKPQSVPLTAGELLMQSREIFPQVI